MGVGGQASLLKPRRVPTWFRTQIPEPLPWEREDEFPSSNHGGSILGSGRKFPNCRHGSGRTSFAPQTTAGPYSVRDAKFPNCRHGSGRTSFPPQITVGPYSVGTQIPQTAAVGVGGQASIPKPWQVPTQFGMKLPKLVPTWFMGVGG